MIPYIDAPILRSLRTIFSLALVGTLVSAGTLLVRGAPPQNTTTSEHAHEDPGGAPAKLVEIVRNSTQQYTDVNAATAANYHALFGCVTGPDHGAMGIHYINLALFGDGEIDATHPEALIYEPVNGALRLVGVEFLVDATTWMAHHSAPPVLEGQAFQFVNSPNRYSLSAFFELHVWAWRHNPLGAFVDWNTHVSCEGQ
jgi:hypothetical protein